jgi:predicted transcriptional regulator
MDATLREFPRIEPVDLFFSYPLHELDADGLLKEANLEESERSMEYGREINNIGKKAKKNDLKGRLADAINRDEEISGKRKTQKEYADEFGVSERTVRSYMRELEEDI